MATREATSSAHRPVGTTGAAATMKVAITDPSLIAASSDGTSGSNGNLANLSAVATAKDPLNGPGWAGFKVPGQWLQQGFDVPQDQTVAMAREFTVAKEMVRPPHFLRFDAIHAGTTYWLNSHELGHAENLFTPVEWDITDAVEFGGVNRLDLEMKVATASERLSCMSSYAGYNLGGIDRAVKIYALPSLYVSSLRLNAGLDKAYRDGELSIDLGLENTDHRTQNGLAVSIQIFNAGGRPVRHLNSQVGLDPLKPGANNVSIASRVANPLKWNAEQPNLYKLVLTLKKDGKALEQIERQIGFRTVEAKNRQPLCKRGARQARRRLPSRD